MPPHSASGPAPKATAPWRCAALSPEFRFRPISSVRLPRCALSLPLSRRFALRDRIGDQAVARRGGLSLRVCRGSGDVPGIRTPARACAKARDRRSAKLSASASNREEIECSTWRLSRSRERQRRGASWPARVKRSASAFPTGHSEPASHRNRHGKRNSRLIVSRGLPGNLMWTSRRSRCQNRAQRPA